MMETNERFRAAWSKAVTAGDTEGIRSLLSDEMTFYSPVLFKPSTDRAYINQVLSFVDSSLSDFEYVDHYEQPGGLAMLFRAKVGDLAVDGVDFFKLTEDGKVRELKVMLRPLNATMLLAQTMKDHFTAMSASE